jgi:hypothetical protein
VIQHCSTCPDARHWSGSIREAGRQHGPRARGLCPHGSECIGEHCGDIAVRVERKSMEHLKKRRA